MPICTIMRVRNTQRKSLSRKGSTTSLMASRHVGRALGACVAWYSGWRRSGVVTTVTSVAPASSPYVVKYIAHRPKSLYMYPSAAPQTPPSPTSAPITPDATPRCDGATKSATSPLNAAPAIDRNSSTSAKAAPYSTMSCTMSMPYMKMKAPPTPTTRYGRRRPKRLWEWSLNIPKNGDDTAPAIAPTNMTAPSARPFASGGTISATSAGTIRSMNT
mmetsp:Transcript_25085/g.87487  ORF Transcript_25085/g.87487 Transcript_25085/m.87487 type:complete len:217 (+) Transcript_25085:522-1172(+)